MDTFQTFLNACRNGQKNIVKLLLERGKSSSNGAASTSTGAMPRAIRRSITSAAKDTGIWRCCCWIREPMPRW